MSGEFSYTNDCGELLYQMVQSERDKYNFRRPDGRGGWVPGLGDVRPVPYRLPQVREATKSGRPVVVAERPEDADLFATIGLAATSSTDAAPAMLVTHLNGVAEVDILYRADREGRVLRDALVLGLQPVCQRVVVVHLPGQATRNDGYGLREYLAAGQSIDDLLTVVRSCRQDQHPTAEDGALLLADLVQYFETYTYLRPPQYDLLAVWTLETHIENLPVNPYVHFRSPEKGSGKTQTLEQLSLVVARPLLAGSITPACLVRTLDKERTTLLLDEADIAFGDKESAATLTRILNIGYRDGLVYRLLVPDGRGYLPAEFRVFGPKAYASLARQPMPDTVEDRSILIDMKRPPATVELEPFFIDDVRPAGASLRARVATWARLHGSTVVDVMKKLRRNAKQDRVLSKLRPRQLEVDAVLVAVCDVVGGDWPRRIRQAVEELVLRNPSEEQSVGVCLLTDVRRVFDELPMDEFRDRIFSRDLVNKLLALEEPSRDWSAMMRGKPINPTWVARRLGDYKAYDVRSAQLRIGDETRKGYLRHCFEEAWNAFCPAVAPSETSETMLELSALQDGGRAKQTEMCFGCEFDPKTDGNGLVSAVSFVKPARGVDDALDLDDPNFVRDVLAMRAAATTAPLDLELADTEIGQEGESAARPSTYDGER